MRFSLHKILALANVRIRFRVGSRYFTLESLGVSLIIGFQVFLLVCAWLLIQGNSVLANEIAIYAYYLLVIGVIFQLLSLLRHEKSKGEEYG